MRKAKEVIARRQVPRPAGIALVAAIALALLAPTVSADTVIGGPGEGAGQYDNPSAIAVDSTSGEVFVADRGNRRIDVFDAAGEFIRAFGWGVVASGPGNKPKNDVQRIEVNATGGSFTLLFVQNGEQTKGDIRQVTGAIAFDASAATLKTTLETLPAIEPGDVTITSAAPEEKGSPWTVEFGGGYADTDVHMLEGSTSKLVGGTPGLSVETLDEGANYEVCEPGKGDACRSGQRGAAAGQLTPIAVAVDPTSHKVYVFDGFEGSSTNEAVNNRIQVFDATGTFLYMLGAGVNTSTNADLCTAASGDVCGRGAKGTGSTEFNQEFSSLALDAGSSLYVNDGGRVQKFNPSGVFFSQVLLPGAASSKLAVDSLDNLYVSVGEAVRKYDSTGMVMAQEFPTSNSRAIAIDIADNLFISGSDSGAFGISRYDSTGAPRSVIYGQSAQSFTSLAPSPAIDTGLLGIDTRVVHIPPHQPGPVVLPVPASTFAAPVGNVKATLHGRINPEGKATTYHFEYVEEPGFENSGFSGPGVIKTAESNSVGSDFQLHPVEAQVTGLTPDTSYRFRLVASNPDGAERAGPTGSFETKAPVELGNVWSTEVGTDIAILHGEANPLGVAATGYFEYVEKEVFEASGFAAARKAPDLDAGAASLDFGSSEAMAERSTTLFSLAPGTNYRYRFVATDHCKADPEVICTFTGQTLSFTTFTPEAPLPPCPNDRFRTGAASFLPDCRGYEMVSPVEKNGSDVDVLANISGYRAGLDQAAVDGQSITYSTYKAFGEIASAPYTNQYLARRDPSSGWSNEAISPERKGPSLMTYQSTMLDRQYKAFSEDLCLAWVVQDANPILAEGGVEGFPGLYKRENCGTKKGSYEALTTVEPPNLLAERFRPELQGISADGSVAIFSVSDSLTENAPTQPATCVGNINNQVSCEPRLYEARDGGLELVCILPDGTPGGGCGAGLSSSFGGNQRESALSHAISEDGTTIFWSQAGSGGSKLYIRINGTKTVGIEAETAAQFWTAAVDGSKAIYTAGGDLFSFDVDAETPTLIAEGVVGVAGASEDASRIYFASSKELVPGRGATGKPNLYLYDAGSGFEFVATLLNTDLVGSGGETISPITANPASRTSRITSDGEQILFMSRGSLTGYDNTDAVSGKAAAEVFLYDAAADGGAGKLACVSCNPSGARPVGRLMDEKGFEHMQAAAWIPAWQSQLYGSRVLSNDGSRLYFNSFEGLIARDTNGQEDVYQWEAPGSGSCTEESPSYSPPNGGCIDLISSGESSKGSELVDIGADGKDVFFKTSQSLVKQDPALIDIYDARVGGGFPPPPTPPAACEGEACAPPASAPEDPTPASSSFRGPGDTKQAVQKKKAKKKQTKQRKKNKNRHRQRGSAR